MLTITRRRGKSISKQAYPRAKRRVARALAAEVMAELEIELAAEHVASERMRAGLAAFGTRAPAPEPVITSTEDLLAYLVSE